jgi:hypothetical protein
MSNPSFSLGNFDLKQGCSGMEQSPGLEPKKYVGSLMAPYFLVTVLGLKNPKQLQFWVLPMLGLSWLCPGDKGCSEDVLGECFA